MILKKFKLCLICVGLLTLVSGCGDKSELKDHLATIELEHELPIVEIEDCRRLSEADDAVYEQQLAACEMYYEAYDLTRSYDYIELYKDDLKEDKISSLCNDRRKELQLEIAQQLHDNIYSMVGNVEDCDNIAAYMKRVNYDVVNFYDYYAEYAYADRTEKEDAICRMLMSFYERSNILAFRFMEDNKEEFIEAALNKIEDNSYAMESLNMYISINNELIEALNTVYGGVPTEYAQKITAANIKLARRLLEEDNDLSGEEIDTLMKQLGEPTDAPTEAPTEEPTEEPTEIPTEKPTLKPTVQPTQKPIAQRTPSPTAKPAVQSTPAPVQEPVVTQEPEPESTPMIIIIGEDE